MASVGTAIDEIGSDGTSRRHADHVRGHELVPVEDTDGIGHQIGTAVPRPPRLTGDRAAGVAVVVADHEPAALGKQPAETRLPPEHRPTGPHDQQNWRIARVAERLRTELDAVRFDHPLTHVRLRLLLSDFRVAR